ncbi:DUF4403 family protein [Bernardetia sp.]|uniref:DUF4403 family protein n=1 Tax=Bernardetia sp. TaxID=1937974 RepID=UPI0025BA9D0D|nr:DUF4403 family protein [Bernardetia sp.]
MKTKIYFYIKRNNQQALLILSFLLTVLFISSCKNKKENTAPKILPFDEAIEHQISFLEVPIAFSVEQIEQKINQAIKGTLYADQSFEDKQSDGLKIRVKKVDNIKISVKENVMYYSVPLHIWVSKRMLKTRFFGKKIEKTKEIDFSLRIQLRSEINLNSDWKLETQTKYTGIEWIKKPKLKVLGINFDLAGLLESQLLQKKNDLERVIDKATSNLKIIEKEVSKIWIKIQEPILIEKKISNGTWLLAEPIQIEASKIEGKDKKLFITTRLKTFLRTVVAKKKGEKPSVAFKKLPSLKQNYLLNSNQNDFELNLRGELPYKAINDLLSEQVKDTVLIVPNTDYKLKINDVEVFGSGKQLFMKLQITGDVNSTIYLNGTPRFDSLDKSLHFDNFDYNLQSEEYLLTAADWMLKATVKEEIQKLLVLPMDNYIKKLPNIIQTALSKGKTGKTALFDLQDFDLLPRFIQVDKEHIRIYVKATGKVGIEIIKL